MWVGIYWVIDDCVMARGCGPTLLTSLLVFFSVRWLACSLDCVLPHLLWFYCGWWWQARTWEVKNYVFKVTTPFFWKIIFILGGYFVICMKYVTVPPKILFIKQLKNPTILYSYVTWCTQRLDTLRENEVVNTEKTLYFIRCFFSDHSGSQSTNSVESKSKSLKEILRINLVLDLFWMLLQQNVRS